MHRINIVLYKFYLIMKITINGLYSSFLLFFFLIMFSGCDNPDDSQKLPQVQIVTLSADKNTIKSDGVDCITFSVLADNKDVSGDAVIICKNDGDKSITDGIFVTTTPGTYEFYSVYEGVTSGTIEVEVLPANLLINSDVTTIKANGISNVTFSVIEFDDDITEIAEIYYVSVDETEVKLEGNVFNSTEEGIFRFFAKHYENVSDTISIEAFPLVLTLVPDVRTFKANGTDVVSFTVMFDEEDVTESASVYMANGNDDFVIENNIFSTEKDGLYGFYAVYNDVISEKVNIRAIVSNLAITPDKVTVRAGEKITFTAISDNVDDVSFEIELVIVKDGRENIINGNTFTPPTFGTYSIYGKYDGKVSKSIEMNVLVGKVILSSDKEELKSTGSDVAQFTVFADGIQVDDGEVFVKSANGDQKLVGNMFSTGLFNTYTFYAKYQDLRSSDVTVRVLKTPFIKRSVAMEAVATWCGYSPEMMAIFHTIHQSDNAKRILTISLHRPTSELASLDVSGDELMEMFNVTGIPLGIMDFERRLFRNVDDFVNSYLVLEQKHLVTSGVAITSRLNSQSIDVTLRIKANDVGNYSVGAIIVEDNVIHGQTIYPDGVTTKKYIDISFDHHGLATFIMPGTHLYPGKLLGSLGGGKEETVSFSINLNRKVVDRIVNYSNCRVVAYVLKNEGSKYFINNAATCPVNGSVDYNHE